MTLFGRVSRESKTDISLFPRIKPFFPLLLYVFAALSLAAIYAVSFQHAEKLIEHDKQHDLGAIADAKVAQIVAWRESQIRSGEHLSRDTQLNVEFDLWLQEGAPENARKQQLRQILDEMQYLNGYQDIQLLDSHNKVRLSVNGAIDLGDEEKTRARQAMDRKEILFLDIHRDTYGNHELSLDLIAPLIVAGKADRVIGAVVLHIPPDRMLYPLLQLWPSQSQSAETLLVRRDGDDVLFLNELRHRKGTALALRMPLGTPDLPAAMAMAVRGVRSTADGVDYRGAWVVAEMRPIPGTPWFMVSKIDRDELFAPLNRLKQWSTGLLFGFMAVSGALLFLWLRNYRSRYQLLKSQRDAAVERELLAMHYEYLTRYANDIIMVADEAGNIVEANDRAQQAYGYSREEMQRMQVGALCDSSSDTGVFQRRIEQFDELGESRFETVNRRKDGSTFPVEVSARAIEIVGVKYLQFIIRDINERRLAEEALRRSETLLNKSQRQAHIGSWELDLKKNILYWSDENYRIFEQPIDGFGASYEAFLATIHPDDREMVNRVYTDSVKNRTPYSIIHRLQFPDRRVKFVQEWCETFYDTDGQPLRSIGTTQDVTVQQMAQNALRKSMQRIEDLYNNAPCGYHSLDKFGLIVQINDTELQWLGYVRDEVVGKINFEDLLAPACRQQFRDKFPEFKQQGFAHDLEYEMVRKDGTSFSVLLNATAVYDADGEYLMSRSTLFDITERKRVEKQLVESEARFHSMADNAPIMIWMGDAQGQKENQGCNYFNQKWYEFTGLPHEPVQSYAWQALIHPDDKARCLDTYRDAFLNAQAFSLEYRLRRHDGVFRWIRDSGVPRSTAAGEFIGFIGICTDVTDLKMFDELRGEMEHVGRLQIAGEMASGLAHELSQPLSAANNYLSAGLHHMAEENWDKDKLLKAVSLAHAQTARAGEIVNHLKELVRKQRQERVMLDINELIRDTLHFMEYDIRHKSVSVVMDFYALPPTQVSRIEIEQVLINLFRNAMDSMDSTSRRVLRVTTRVIESGFILVSVSDTGTGILPDALDKVFNPFHTSKKGGLGLGLPICRSLIENHGGQIWAEHNGDEGAEFNFTLPVGACYA